MSLQAQCQCDRLTKTLTGVLEDTLQSVYFIPPTNHDLRLIQALTGLWRCPFSPFPSLPFFRSVHIKPLSFPASLSTHPSPVWIYFIYLRRGEKPAKKSYDKKVNKSVKSVKDSPSIHFFFSKKDRRSPSAGGRVELRCGNETLFGEMFSGFWWLGSWGDWWIEYYLSVLYSIGDRKYCTV